MSVQNKYEKSTEDISKRFEAAAPKSCGSAGTGRRMSVTVVVCMV